MQQPNRIQVAGDRFGMYHAFRIDISACQYLLQVVLPERLGEKPQLPTHVEKATAKAFAFDACVDGRASQVSSMAMFVQ